MNKLIEVLKKNKKEVGLYLAIVLLGFLCIGPFFKFHMTPDSYLLINPKNDVYSRDMLGSVVNSISGRPLSDMFLFYVNMIGLNMMSNQGLFNFLSIVILIIATILLYKTCEELTKNRTKSIWITGLASFLIIFNAFSFELFVYNVMTSLSIQYIIVIYAVRILLKELTIRNICISTILNIIGLCIYQGIGPLFIGLGMILLGYKYKNEPLIQNIKRYFIIGIIYGISCISNLILINITDTNRYESITLGEGIKRIFETQQTIWIDSYGFFPKFFFLGIIVLFLAITFIYIIKKDKKNFWNMSICIVGAIVMTSIAALIPYIVSTVSIVPRTILTISTIPWLILLFMGINYIDINSMLRLLIGIIIGGYIFVLVNLSYRLVDAIVRINDYDKYIAGKVMRAIEEYELTNNIEVTKFSYCYDENYTWWIPNQPNVNIDCLGRALTVSWSWKDVIWHYYGKDFEIVPMDDDVYNTYIKGKDWSEFSEEQLIFVKDTLYMVSY